MALPGARRSASAWTRRRRAEDFGLLRADGELLAGAGRRHRCCALHELPLAGLHNAANALAALALCARARPAAARRCWRALRDFSGLPHRVEQVAEIDGVRYYDDSKGTNVGATVAALNGLARRHGCVLIAGGEGKGQDFAPLRRPVARHARARGADRARRAN